MADKEFSFALVGCGRIAHRHAEQIIKHGRLVAVCDIDSAKADAFALQYSAKAYYDINDLLEKEKAIDIISICTPNGLHAEHTIASLNAGINVLCEKPLAIKVSDGEQMVQAAEKNKKKLFVVKQNRYNPPVVALKNAIDTGKFGRLFSMQLNCFWNRNAGYYNHSWKGTLALDGGTLYTQFSHFIDLIYWLLGDVKSVSAMVANFGHKNIIEFEDTGVVLLQFESGVVGTLNYTVNSYAKNMEGSLTIFGENGTAKVGGQYLNELEYQNFKNYTIENLPNGNTANNYGSYEGSMSNHDKVYESVVTDLRTNSNTTANAYEGLKTIEIISKIYKAAKKV